VRTLPITAWCEALGITQSGWARRAGLAPAVLSDYARGRRNPTLRSIAALARAIDRAPWELLRGPRPGECLPSEQESRVANLRWFGRLTPSARARAAERGRRFALRGLAFARARGSRRGVR
jgi:transcriptional regulator with XRE-family HTH domain